MAKAIQVIGITKIVCRKSEVNITALMPGNYKMKMKIPAPHAVKMAMATINCYWKKGKSNVVQS